MRPATANHQATGAAWRRCISALLLVFGVAFGGVCRGDALFVNDYAVDEILLGKKEAVLTTGYTDQAMYVEKETRFTGSWMKRFFGEVKEEKSSTFFLLAENQIREIDWQNGRIYVFPFERLSDIGWIKQKKNEYTDVAEIIKARYQVKTPEVTISIRPQKETVQGIDCQVAEARLRLETFDRKKNAASVTLVDQILWVSEAVPGFAAYQQFHQRLARRLGLEAERLGCFNFMLRYWDGPLSPIRQKLDSVRGYPVQSHLTVQAQYTTGVGTDSPKTITKQLKTESVTLREVRLEKIDESRYREPDDFETIQPE